MILPQPRRQRSDRVRDLAAYRPRTASAVLPAGAGLSERAGNGEVAPPIPAIGQHQPNRSNPTRSGHLSCAEIKQTVWKRLLMANGLLELRCEETRWRDDIAGSIGAGCASNHPRTVAIIAPTPTILRARRRL